MTIVDPGANAEVGFQAEGHKNLVSTGTRRNPCGRPLRNFN